jgi:hypothetical protein
MKDLIRFPPTCPVTPEPSDGKLLADFIEYLGRALTAVFA